MTSPRTGPGGRGHWVALGVVIFSALLAAGLIVAPMAMFASGGFLSISGNACSSGGAGPQPPASAAADAIPASYLRWFKVIGARYGVPWVILAGIGKVESDDGQSTAPGVHSGANPFGAAGPMQIGIGGAAGNTWGGAPVHPASEVVDGVATDANGDGVASVYEPADAIAGAARYLLEHGVRSNAPAAIFAYNHLSSYVQDVESYASSYARGGYQASPVSLAAATTCLPDVAVPNSVVSAVIAYAQAQLGKPYQWGGTGPNSFDCSGLVMESYLAAGIAIPRTAAEQYDWGPRVPRRDVQPGDLVFFAGAYGTPAAPGHVGLVIGGGKMIEAYATGFPIKIASYIGQDPVGFTRPWAHAGVHLATAEQAAANS